MSKSVLCFALLAIACVLADSTLDQRTPAAGPTACSQTVGADAAPSGVTIGFPVTYRDFQFYSPNKPTHQGNNPDFQRSSTGSGGLTGGIGYDTGIVTSAETSAAGTGIPIYAGGSSGTLTTTNAASFQQWYDPNAPLGYDSPCVITGHTFYLTQDVDGYWKYSSSSFFPIDGQGYGNQGTDSNNIEHNFSFTLSLRMPFVYQGGGTFTVTGDDDIFVYVNGQLVVNNGGVHAPQTASFDVSTLGLTWGTTYYIDFFYAERHTPGSTLSITTSINFGTQALCTQTVASETAPSGDVFGLSTTFRDFEFVSVNKFTTKQGNHPDFQNVTIGNDTGIVSTTLGSNGKPVYAPGAWPARSPTTNGYQYFSQWYTEEFVDIHSPCIIWGHVLWLVRNPVTNVWSYSSPDFYPIDTEGYGNQGTDLSSTSHNFAFTAEAHTQFRYTGMYEWVTVNSDDDFYLFINGQLVINAGGIHNAFSSTVYLSSLGLTRGNTYSFDLFYAERHTPGATLEISTNIDFKNETDWCYDAVTPDSAPSGDYVALYPTFRDFHAWTPNKPTQQGSHADFQDASTQNDTAIVTSWLDSNWLPVYGPGSTGSTPTTHDQANFTQWYSPYAPYNIHSPCLVVGHVLYLQKDVSNWWSYDALAFFPIDNEGYGDSGKDLSGTEHNFGFTMAFDVSFTYTGTAEKLQVGGDDDVFVYVNGQLVINMGGIHDLFTETVDLVAWASTLGLTVGSTYRIDVFYAERHTPGASFVFRTNIDFNHETNNCVTDCPTCSSSLVVGQIDATGTFVYPTTMTLSSSETYGYEGSVALSGGAIFSLCADYSSYLSTPANNPFPASGFFTLLSGDLTFWTAGGVQTAAVTGQLYQFLSNNFGITVGSSGAQVMVVS